MLTAKIRYQKVDSNGKILSSGREKILSAEFVEFIPGESVTICHRSDHSTHMTKKEDPSIYRDVWVMNDKGSTVAHYVI